MWVIKQWIADPRWLWEWICEVSERKEEREKKNYLTISLLTYSRSCKERKEKYIYTRERERDELNNIVERSLSSLVIDVNEIREKKNTATQIGHTSIGHWSFNVRTNYTLCVCVWTILIISSKKKNSCLFRSFDDMWLISAKKFSFQYEIKQKIR